MNEKIKKTVQAVLDEIRLANEANFEFIGMPDPEEIEEQCNFTYMGEFDRLTPDDNSTDEEIREATISAIKDILINYLLDVAERMYKDIDAEVFFDRNDELWYLSAADTADCFLDGGFLDDWERVWKDDVQTDLDEKFGKRCFSVKTFADLMEWYEDNQNESFEDWFCDEIGVDKERYKDCVYTDNLSDYLNFMYGDNRFSVCIPENLWNQYKKLPRSCPLDECDVYEIDE